MRKLIAAIVVLGIVYFLLPEHVQMGLKHNFANVDDYKIFPSHMIHHSTRPQPWKISETYNKISPSEASLSLLERERPAPSS